MAEDVRIHLEANPTEEDLARAEAVEASLGDGVDADRLTEEGAGALLEELALALESVLPGHVHGYAPSTRPLAPTRALPGTPEKVRAMRARVTRGESCFHPGDPRTEGGAP